MCRSVQFVTRASCPLPSSLAIPSQPIISHSPLPSSLHFPPIPSPPLLPPFAPIPSPPLLPLFFPPHFPFIPPAQFNMYPPPLSSLTGHTHTHTHTPTHRQIGLVVKRLPSGDYQVHGGVWQTMGVRSSVPPTSSRGGHTSRSFEL